MCQPQALKDTLCVGIRRPKCATKVAKFDNVGLESVGWMHYFRMECSTFCANRELLMLA